ncbi:hypothetical protein VTK73DRAFT_8384 [Phialemonium thermophilum]|uniref:Uncharacterized protein n=1 Tax=Phialemonium thermophilum TaxID=223376 RepID=A0ABR3XQP6_9PEZI
MEVPFGHPHYKSGRFSTLNLTVGYVDGVEQCSHQHHMDSSRTRQAWPVGDVVRTPTMSPLSPIMSPATSHVADGSACRSRVASISLGDVTTLTVPDLEDNDESNKIHFDEPDSSHSNERIGNRFGFTQSNFTSDDPQAEAQNSRGDDGDVFLDENVLPSVEKENFTVERSARKSSQWRASHSPAAATAGDPIRNVGVISGSAFAQYSSRLSVRQNEHALAAQPGGENRPATKMPAFGDAGSNGASSDVDSDSDYGTSSDWDQYEEVQKRLAGYYDFRRTIAGHGKWTTRQAKLHKLMALRGSWPMLDREWTFNFRMRNIHPWVYAPQGSKKTVAIHAKRDEFRAAKSLEALFDLSSLVCGYHQTKLFSRIGTVIRRTLRKQIDWAIRDAGVANRAYLPIIEVYEFGPDGSGVPNSPHDGNVESVVDANGNSDPISDKVEERLKRLAARHRRDLVLPGHESLPDGSRQYRREPPLLFAFVIVQHMVMIVNLESARHDNEVMVFAELNMSEADQWLWNALAIALPINMARDELWNIKDTLPIIEEPVTEDVDA